MGSIVLYIIEWAFALLVLLAIYKAVFCGTTFHRFNRFYLLGATLLSALLPLVHVTLPDSAPLVSEMTIQDTEFAQELSGTLTFVDEPAGFQIVEVDADDIPEKKESLWAVGLVCTYVVYVLTLVIGWSRGIIRARRFLRGKPRRRLSRTVWLVTHNEPYGPFSWMNYIAISDKEVGFARLASLRHEYSHVRLMHSVDLIILLACTTVNPVCWLVLQEIKIVHEFEADDEVINRYGIHEQDYQRLLLIKAVGAEAYALASSFNLNIKKRIIMMNKKKTLKRRLLWLLLLVPMLGMTSVLFARTEEALNFDIVKLKGTITVKGKVVDEKGKPIANAIITESRPGPAVGFILHGFTDKNGEFSFNTVEMNENLGVGKDGIGTVSIKDYYGKDLVITLPKGSRSDGVAISIKERNLMRVIVKADGMYHVMNGAVNKDVDLGTLRDIALEFIANPKNDSRLPAIEEYEIPGFKTVETTLKHVIVIEREKGASLENRDEAYGVIQNALYELRVKWCIKEFGHQYSVSTPDEQDYARGMYPNKIVMPEIRYFCDLKLGIRKNAIVAEKELIDQYSADPVPVPWNEQGGQLLGVAKSLEQYLDKITADGDTRIRGVKLELSSNADQNFVQEVMDVLWMKGVISVNTTELPPTRNRLSFTVTGNKPNAGSMIGGAVTDEDGPIVMATVNQRDVDNHIVAQAITDPQGNWAMPLLDPDNKLEFKADGHTVIQCFITGVHYDIKLAKGDGFELIHNDGEFTRLTDLPEPDGIYITVDEMPMLPGGTMALLEFMRTNIQYPANAREKNIQGRAVVSFVVHEDGHLSDFKITKSAGNEELDNEAMRMCKSMPNWNPGVENGKKVKVRTQLPVNFRLN